MHSYSTGSRTGSSQLRNNERMYIMNGAVALKLRVPRTSIQCCRRTGSKKLLFSSDSTSPTKSAHVLLQQVKDGTLSIEKAVVELSRLNLVSTGSPASVSSLSSFANIDHDRYTRTNFPEVIFAQSKTSYQVGSILDEMAERQIIKQYQTVAEAAASRQEQKCYIPPILATRVTPEMYNEINTSYKFQHGSIEYNPLARIILMHADIKMTFTENSKDNSDDTAKSEKRVVVATAGTTDIMVAEEAAVTLEASEVPVDRIYDVGVAGLHRIIHALPKLTNPNVGCIIVCAGMDGALPSVVGGLVHVPVIAVPTSIGYGASFQGVSALLTMLNSCAPGVGVVNIDNGFGAAALAYKCIQ